MERTLTITDAADDTALLTREELYAAVGLTPDSPTDESLDTELEDLGDAVADDIMSECNIAVGSGSDEATLLTETVTETFYDVAATRALFLSRRHNIAITSVTVDGSAVSSSDWAVNAETGILTRLNRGIWCGNTIVVIYSAGFDEAPAELKDIAAGLVRSRYLERNRDQFVKSESIEIVGVETKTQDFWVGALPGQVSEGPIPKTIAGRLKRYRNVEAAIG